MKRIKFIVMLMLIIPYQLFSQNKNNGLIEENMLHPGDAFTGYTFDKGEWAYNQALTPYPSWAWWGITDWLTTEIDLEAWLGGVPSFNFRFRILEQKKMVPNLSYEIMYQYIATRFDQMENLDYLNIYRKGNSLYNHLNASWRLSDRIYMHLSGGFTYSENITIENNDTVNYTGKSFKDLISPDVSLGVDWRLKPWITFHSTYSYGSTFLYIDNVPRKKQFVVGTRVAPFVNNRIGFFKCFRFELAYLSIYFDDAKRDLSGPIGFAYWQWNFN
ncbi:hypothetical protein ACFLSE_05760 [Bacteroidota bacterium]